jgi:DNA-binding MarR family transcriptional regulator
MSKVSSRAATTAEADVLMRASKVVSAAVARSVAVAGDRVSMPGLRVLVLLEARPSMNLTAVAEHLGVNTSTASRSCDRLVVEGLVDRRDDPDDRRNIALTLTKEGRHIVRAVMAERKRVLVSVLEAMPPQARADLVRGLAEFSDAAADLGVDGPEQ